MHYSVAQWAALVHLISAMTDVLNQMTRFTLDGIHLDVPEEVLNLPLTSKMRDGSYEAVEAQAARMRVKPRHRVLELGGGLGYVSAICAQIAEPGNVMTVEANPAMLKVIRHNLALNGVEGVRLLHGAVVGDGAEGDSVLFRVGQMFCGSAIADTGNARDTLVEVPMLRLSPLLAAHRPDVVIMDIEGAERYLFDAPWPDHVTYVMLELHPKRYPTSTVKRIVDCMSESGLTYDPGPSRGSLLGFRRVRG